MKSAKKPFVFAIKNRVIEMRCAKTKQIAPPNVQVVHDGAYLL